MKKKILIILLSILSVSLFSQSSFSKGKTLFSEDRVEESIPYFEEALVLNPNLEVYQYLSEAYLIISQPADSALVLEEAIASGIDGQDYLHFKLGNSYHILGNYREALNNYLKVIELRKAFLNESFLNVANVSVDLGLYGSAIDNYSKYLELEPNTPQKRKIVKMILLLKKKEREERTKDMALDNQPEERLDNALTDEERRQLALREQQLIEERIQAEKDEEALRREREQLERDEALVENPPDPEIEKRKDELLSKEEALKLREEELARIEEELKRKQNEIAVKESNPLDSGVSEDELKQKAIMDDILKSLEKIGENAKTINASSEEVIEDLEESDIDE